MKIGTPERETYKLQTIGIRIRLHKRVDVPLLHPLGYHHEPVPGNRYSQQRQYVRMTKGLPYHDPLAKFLVRGVGSDKHDETRETHLSNPIQVTRRVYPQSLGRNHAVLMFAFPHVCEPTITLWSPCRVVTEWDWK